MEYFYIYKNMGLTASGGFTKDRNRWITFLKDDMERMTKHNIKPYGATYKGTFIETNKF